MVISMGYHSEIQFAQGSFECAANSACFQLLVIQGHVRSLLKPVEACCTWRLLAATKSSTLGPKYLGRESVVSGSLQPLAPIACHSELFRSLTSRAASNLDE